MKHRLPAALLALMLAFPIAAAAEFYTEMPALLRFTQETSVTAQSSLQLQCTYPDTASDEVDVQMRSVIDGLLARLVARLPDDPAASPILVDAGALISRSGESLLSFLTMAQATQDKRHLGVDFDTRVYDMHTGALVTLSDLFSEDSEAYALLAQRARSALESAFPDLEADADALDALCAPEAIRHAPFTLGASRLTLTFRADAIYPGRDSLLHVNVGYSLLREMMTDYGRRQTDNSRFQLLALTYDDGPARGATRAVLEALREYGAQATFFVVGTRFDNNHDMLLTQQNGNYSIQSHSFTHRYPDDMGPKEAHEEKQRMATALGGITGVEPTMMRAPGGHAAYYARKDTGLPMIQWSLASGDSGNPHIDKIANKVIVSADDGEIVLMHDLNGGSPSYTRQILKALTDKGFLLVTLEELFDDAGVPLEKNRLYFSTSQIE